NLYHTMQIAGLPIGVSVLCPGWVRTRIIDADRNWPAELGDRPERDPTGEVMEQYVRRAIDEGAQPAFIADAVADAMQAGRFWVIPQDEFLDLVVSRWGTISERADPIAHEHVPGMPPRSQVIAEVLAALGMEVPKGDGVSS
ncbi:MAG: hypothetical protein ACRDZ2_03525, partial [Ilumatobacteraceae bacterium]